MLYYDKSARDVLAELKSSAAGLHPTEAVRRLQLYGPNSLKLTDQQPFWRKIIEPFANIFMLVLAIAVIISLLHGDKIDAIIISAIMLASALVYYIQRFSTERILRSLQKHSAQKIEVLRDQKICLIDAEQIVPGDLLLLKEGEKVPADARIYESKNLRVDESQLTGESLPIEKNTQIVRGNKEVYEQTNLLFQGSFVVSGTVTAIVIRTGNDTEFGKMASLAEQAEFESPIQKKIDRLVNQIIGVVAAMSAVAFVLALIRGIDFLEAIRFVMALAVSAVPESLPVAISVVLVLGMRRMAAKKALVRNMRAIETVGALNTIATDKTGTLTQNKLTVQEIWQPKYSKHNLVQAAARCVNQSAGGAVHDSVDLAIINFSKQHKITFNKARPLSSLPFNQQFSMSGNLWHKGEKYDLTAKGAPENIMLRSIMTEKEREAAEQALHELTSRGFRVIGLAQTELNAPIEDFDELNPKTHFTFLGFIAVADVLRPEAARAIKAAQKAGVTVRMITGDHFETAYHIGKQLGMVEHKSQVFDSRRMQVMTDEELSRAIQKVRVFSRVLPEDKFRILSILKQQNITAMTGDGVNDVPALSNAHVGIAMGSGAQIAKDASDIILLDDNFKSVIDALREGRIIFANIRRMLYYLLSTNAGEALTMLGSLIIGLPMPLVPVQILWINLVTDTSMVIPLGLEKSQKNIMKQPPLKIKSPILSKYLVSRMIIVALSMAITTLLLYWAYSADYGHQYGRTIAFCALVVMQWANALNARSDLESVFSRIFVWSAPFYFGLLVAICLQMLAIFGPLSAMLHVSSVAIGDLIITGIIAFCLPIILVEIHKFYGRYKAVRQ